jgi:Uma2 family endonuclease
MTNATASASLDQPMSVIDAPLHRLSIEDVRRMGEVGILSEEDRVELVEGVLVDVNRPGPEHSAIVSWLTRHFVRADGDWEVRVQDLLLVEAGFLLPDVMLIDPVPRDRHPAHARLVVEVSVSTLRYDSHKAARYARTHVDEYWIVDPAARTLIVHRGPRGSEYASVTRHGDGETVTALVGAPPVDVTELFGC